MDVKPSGYRPGVVLLLLLAIFCCRYPETTAGSLNRFTSDVEQERDTKLEEGQNYEQNENVIEKFSVGKAGVVLLLLVAIFFSQFPETTAIHMDIFFTCIMSCSEDKQECILQCEEGSNCAAFSKFCKELCLSAQSFCEERCFEEAAI
ncbi:hypothetical protein LSAT2_021945 [Lamellibrachia satsuma]|nr:hypothetical protein LSAT2_021945 [Lamellibrachia satsuma]